SHPDPAPRRVVGARAAHAGELVAEVPAVPSVLDGLVAVGVPAAAPAVRADPGAVHQYLDPAGDLRAAVTVLMADSVAADNSSGRTSGASWSPGTSKTAALGMALASARCFFGRTRRSLVVTTT